MHTTKLILPILLLGFWQQQTFADDLHNAIDKICAGDPYVCDKRNRFQSYQPNFAVFRFDEGKDDPVQFHYSFRYYLTDPDCIKGRHKKYSEEFLHCLKKFHTRSETYLTYTGDFDFYMGVRESSPVINRVSNPAMHRRKYLSRKYRPLLWLDFALEHRSNGQVVDATEIIDDPGSSNNGRFRAQVEFENENFQYFDALSRSVNYFSIEGHFLFNLKGDEWCSGLSCIKLWLKFKPWYFEEESEITWGPKAGQGRNFADYDRLRLVLSTRIPTSLTTMELSAIWHVGDQWVDEDSFDIQLYIPFNLANRRIPLFFRYHSGPMATLSDYGEHQKSYGIGLNFY